MQKYRENVLVSGEPVANATVTVRNRATGTLAILYSDNGVTQMANPVTTNDLGEFWFYAADGRYDLLIEKTGVAAITPLLLTDVLLEDPVDGISEVSVKSVNTLDPDSEGNVTLTTANIAEGSNLYHTSSRVLAVVLSGLSLATNAAITATDTMLGALGKLQKQITDLIATVGGKQDASGKDASGGYAGLTLFKLNMRNVADTFTSFLTNANTAARTYTFPDKDGTVAMTSDISGGVMVLLGQATVGAAVAQIDNFLNIFASPYDRYVVDIQRLAVSAGSTLQLGIAKAGSVDATASYSPMLAHAGTSASYGGGPVGLTPSNMLANANPTAQFTLEIRNVNDTNGSKGISVRGGYLNTSSATVAVVSEGHYTGAGTITGFRLSVSNSANITSGTVRVYGIKNS